MDAYEDALRAFDSLLRWLREDPYRESSTIKGETYVSVRRPGEYGSEMTKRSNRLADCINHLMQDGFSLPDSYLWRRFREAMESGCYFETDGYGRHDVEGQREMIRIIETAQTEFVALKEPKPRVKEPKPERVVAQRATAPTPASVQDKTPKKKSENVGYGWPIKLVLAAIGSATFFFWYPKVGERLSPHIAQNPSFIISQFTVTLGIFMGIIAIGNMIRKP